MTRAHVEGNAGSTDGHGLADAARAPFDPALSLEPVDRWVRERWADDDWWDDLLDDGVSSELWAARRWRRAGVRALAWFVILTACLGLGALATRERAHGAMIDWATFGRAAVETTVAWRLAHPRP